MNKHGIEALAVLGFLAFALYASGTGKTVPVAKAESQHTKNATFGERFGEWRFNDMGSVPR